MRWMVRRDGMDLGLWTAASPADLISPLDVHVIRYARPNSLTTRRTINWSMAEEITQHFRKITPADPMRYDFGISHYGMVHRGAANFD